MPDKIHHFAVEVSDAEKSAAFYCDLLGFTRGDRHDFPDRGRVIIFVSLGDVALELLQGPAGQADQGRAPLRCSFCGREKPRQIEELIAGPEVYICTDCVALCNRILEDATGQRPKKVLGYKHVCLQTDDVDGDVARLKAAGVKIATEPFDTQINSRIAFVEDPDGLTVELWQSL